LSGAWEWKGKLYEHLVKLKVGAKGVDCHIDAGRRNFFNNNLETNLFWGFVIPPGNHSRNSWQWSWRSGMMYQTNWQGWNLVGVSHCNIEPNTEKTGPGSFSWTDRYCVSKDEHEIHHNLNVVTLPDGKFCPNIDAAYQYKGGDWMTYVKGHWSLLNNTIPALQWGASYQAHKKYANLAYRVNLNHAKQTAKHSAGFEGKCYDGKVYYKAHVHYEHANEELKKENAPAQVAKLHMYNEHKCNANFSYKYKVIVNLMEPSDFQWGAVFSSSC